MGTVQVKFILNECQDNVNFRNRLILQIAQRGMAHVRFVFLDFARPMNPPTHPPKDMSTQRFHLSDEPPNSLRKSSPNCDTSCVETYPICARLEVVEAC